MSTRAKKEEGAEDAKPPAVEVSAENVVATEPVMTPVVEVPSTTTTTTPPVVTPVVTVAPSSTNNTTTPAAVAEQNGNVIDHVDDVLFYAMLAVLVLFLAVLYQKLLVAFGVIPTS